MPSGLEVTVPEPIPDVPAVRTNRFRSKPAVTDLAASIVTVQLESSSIASQPLQPVKTESSAGTASSLTGVPLGYDSEQSSPQVIPSGVDVTKPPPSPVRSTVRSKLGVIVMVNLPRLVAAYSTLGISGSMASCCACSAVLGPLSLVRSADTDKAKD